MNIITMTQTNIQSKPAVFLDRDGTICEYVPELHSADQFVLRVGAARAIQKLNQAGFWVFVVTNQPMIAKGIISFSELDRVHQKMRAQLLEGAAHIDQVYFCPHHPDHQNGKGLVEYQKTCECRKPRVGMLEQACREFSVDRARNFMVGDTWRDVECGKNFGLKTVGLLGGAGYPYKDSKPAEPDFLCADLSQAVEWILTQ